MARVTTDYTAEIAHLRSYGKASNELEVYDGVVYWTDAQLLAILEQSIDYMQVGLVPTNTHSEDGYKEFTFNVKGSMWIDQYDVSLTGTDSIGTVDTATQTISFTTQQLTDIMIHAPFFNMTKALAKLWEIKAAQRFELIRVKGGANQLYMEQEYEHCMQRAAYYRSRIGRRHSWKGGGW